MFIRTGPHKFIVPLVLGATMLLILPALVLYPFHSDVDVYHCVAMELLRRPPTSSLPPFLATFPGMVYVHLIAIDVLGNTEQIGRAHV